MYTNNNTGILVTNTMALFYEIKRDDGGKGNLCLKVKFDGYTEVSSVVMVSAQEIKDFGFVYRVPNIIYQINRKFRNFFCVEQNQEQIKLELILKEEYFEIVGQIKMFCDNVRVRTFGLPDDKKFQLIISQQSNNNNNTVDEDNDSIDHKSNNNNDDDDDEDEDEDEDEDDEHMDSSEQMAPVFIGFQNTDVVEWGSAHVQAWMKTLGPRISRLSSMFSNVTGTDLLLFKCKEDLAAKMPDAPKINVKLFFRKINELRTERTIDESVVQTAKYMKNPGIIGLGNIGNTCFMNSSIQVLLQTPHLTSYLRKYAVSNNNNNNYNYNNNTNIGHMLSAVSQLVVLARNKENLNKYAHPYSIRNALRRTNPQLCDGGQHDSFECLSSILHALDEDIHGYILREKSNHHKKKPNLILEKRNVRPFANDDKEKMFVEQMFRKFNPYQSAVRSAMNGILRKNRTCYSCRRQSVSYVTFGSLVLPIVKQPFVTISIDVWGINTVQNTNNNTNNNNNNNYNNNYNNNNDGRSRNSSGHRDHDDDDDDETNNKCYNNNNNIITKSTITVNILPDDCSTVVKARVFGCLKEQGLIVADASFNDCEIRIGNIFIGNNNNYNGKYDNDNAEPWVQYFDNDGEDCNMSVMQHPFVILQPSSNEQHVQKSKTKKLCNIMQFVVAVVGRTNKFKWKYHQLLSFINGQVFTGCELLDIVGRSVNNTTVVEEDSMELHILMNGEFVENTTKKQYKMDSNRILCLVAVLVSKNKVWKDYDPSNVKTNAFYSEILSGKFTMEDILKSLRNKLNNVKRISEYEMEPSVSNLVQNIRATYNALFAKYGNQVKIINALRCVYGATSSAKHYHHLNRQKKRTTNLETIDDCLADYFAEHVKLSSACDCSSNVFQCSTSIAYAPINLFIKLERSVERHQKNEKLVGYSTNNLLSIPVMNDHQKYGLYGVCCHVHGRTQSGHYFAYVKSLENDGWYEANDSSVCEMRNTNKVETNSAIVLLYTKA